MSVLQIKQRLSRLSAKEQREIQIYLHQLRRRTPAWKKATAKRIAEVKAGKFTTIKHIVVASRQGAETVFASAAVEFFVGQTKRRRRKILDRAHESAADPFLLPDLRSTDSTGREIFQFMSDDFIFDYWVDHAARQVIITGVDDVE